MKKLTPDEQAAYAYVDSVIDTADIKISAYNVPSWHGWALRDAFLAGIKYANGSSRTGLWDILKR